ncbi:MAG TPA: hypothetical protein P5530_03870 [Candidatus Diapherotrites archaeon]|jgi:signal peptidase I|nr:hypothetical protein [Candidatus Diapherotrites archaeon]
MKKKNKASKKQPKKNFWYYLDPFNYLDMGLEKWIGKPEGFWKSAIYWLCYICLAFFLAIAIYKILGWILGVSMPMAIVYSSSMEPNLHRGDIVILTKAKNLKVEEVTINENIANKDLKDFAKLSFSKNRFGIEEIEYIKIGDKNISLIDTIENKNSVVVYQSNVTGKDTIHRAIVKINAKDGTFLLTKGDNHKTNVYIDQDCDIEIINEKITIQKPCLNVFPIKEKELKGKKLGKIPYIGYIKLVLFQ